MHMEWQGFAPVLFGAFLFAFYEVVNKKLLVKKAPADCISTVNFLGSGALLLAASFLAMNHNAVCAHFYVCPRMVKKEAYIF